MRPVPSKLTACLACGTLGVLLMAATSSPAVAEDADSSDGFVELFNGKTLDGWRQINGLAPYIVEEGGVIKGTTQKGSPNSFLCTKKAYGDFILEFEVKVDDRLNSGVQIRSQSKADYKNGRVHGPQVEIEAAPGDAGYIYSEGTGRKWLSTDRERNRDAFQNGEWNKYRVEARGANIKTFVNGKPVADMTDAESSRKGFIGLQVHSFKGDPPAEVRWRNIRIKELD